MSINSIKETLSFVLKYAICTSGAESIGYQVQKAYGAPYRTGGLH